MNRGPGAGSYLLPVTRTSSPIDSDIVQDISTEPVRQSLAVIIDEFGTGLAARGSDLNAVIHRANPALGHTDKVLQILAGAEPRAGPAGDGLRRRPGAAGARAPRRSPAS